MRRIIEQPRVTRDTEPGYPAAREFPTDGVAPSASASIRCARAERESAFAVQASANSAWLASHVSAKPSASPSACNALAREEKQRAARTKAILAREKIAHAKALLAIPCVTWSPEERARDQSRRDVLQAERAAWSGVDA